MSSNERMSERLALVGTIDPDAYGTGAQTMDVIDMQHYRRVLFTVLAGTLGTSGTIDFAIYGDSGSNGSFATLITGKEVTQITDAGTHSDKQRQIEVTAEEVAAQGLRYLRASMTVGTATSDACAIAQAEGLRYRPASAYDLASVDEIIT